MTLMWCWSHVAWRLIAWKSVPFDSNFLHGLKCLHKTNKSTCQPKNRLPLASACHASVSSDACILLPPLPRLPPPPSSSISPTLPAIKTPDTNYRHVSTSLTASYPSLTPSLTSVPSSHQTSAMTLTSKPVSRKQQLKLAPSETS